MLTVAKFERYDMINNVGETRPAFTIWFSGCNFKCNGCHNQSLWDKRNGYELPPSTVYKTVIEQCKAYKLKTVVMIGGEPLQQDHDDFIALCKAIKDENIEIYLYTGYTFEEVPDDIRTHVNTIKCGRYDETLLTGKFPASSNQYLMKKIDGKWVRVKTDD